jgi:ABC-type sugar transport system permease subunit
MTGNKGMARRLTICAFLLPSFLGLITFSVIPILYSLVISATDWNGLNSWNLAAGSPRLIGAGNYAQILGGMQGINPNYYEAAQIDGANFRHRFVRITLPLLSPVLFFVMVICIINSFQLFPQVMIMTEGAGPYGATEVMVERIYKYAFRYHKMGYAAAFSWLLFLIIFTFTMLQLKLQKKWVHYDA